MQTSEWTEESGTLCPESKGCGLRNPHFFKLWPIYKRAQPEIRGTDIQMRAGQYLLVIKKSQ